MFYSTCPWVFNKINFSFLSWLITLMWRPNVLNLPFQSVFHFQGLIHRDQSIILYLGPRVMLECPLMALRWQQKQHWCLLTLAPWALQQNMVKCPSHCSTSQGAKASTKDARSSVVDTAYLNTYKVYLKITLDIFLDVLGLTLTKQGSLTEGEGSVQLTSLCQLV